MTSTLTPETPTKKRFYTRPRFLIGAGLLAIPALVLAWWLGSPLILDTVVDEDFPVASQTAGDVTPSTSASTEPAASTPQPAPAVAPTTPPVTQADEEPVPAASGDPVPGAESATEAGDAPLAVLAGDFAGADEFHQGSGTATIYELEDGSHVLRFEGFEVTNGPDLHVLISETDSVTGPDDLDASGYVDLGKLKGNVGNQNYELVRDFDLTGPVTITIYCDPFHVVFATATLSPAG